MASKLNIFTTLPQSPPDSEDEAPRQTNKKTTESRNPPTRQQDNRGKQESKQQGQGQKTQGTQGTQGAQKNRGPQEVAQKEQHGATKDHTRKQKVDLDHPHQQERHSGTGQSAYGGKSKKEGAGKGNWGNYKDDKREPKEGEEEVQEDKETEVKPEEPEGVTLKEYYGSTKYSSNQPQVNEAKAKITKEQLMKEVGTATLLKTKIQQQVDDHKVGKKKDHLDINHKAGVNTEHANLLNFRTGFVEKEYKKKERDENGDAPRRPYTKKENTEEVKEEGEVQAEEAGKETVEGQEGQAEEGEKKRYGNRNDNYKRRGDGGNYRGQGKYRGDRQQGDRPQGDRPHGDRPQGDRPYGDKPRGERPQHRGDKPHGDRPQGDRPQGDKPHGDRPKGDRPQGDRPKRQYGEPKAQVFDESAFPKLG